MSNKRNLGDKLQDLRAEKNLSLKALSEELGGSPTTSTLGDYENDRKEPSFKNMIALANYFGVSLDWLAGRIECRNQKQEDIYKATGLNKKSVDSINAYNELFGKQAINKLLYSDNFYLMLESLCKVEDRSYSHAELLSMSKKKRSEAHELTRELTINKYTCELHFRKIIEEFGMSENLQTKLLDTILNGGLEIQKSLFGRKTWQQ